MKYLHVILDNLWKYLSFVCMESRFVVLKCPVNLAFWPFCSREPSWVLFLVFSFLCSILVVLLFADASTREPTDWENHL